MIRCYNVVGRFSDCAPSSTFILSPPTFTGGPWTLELTGDVDQYVVLGVLCIQVELSSLPGSTPLPDHSLIDLEITNLGNTVPSQIRAVSIIYV